MNNRFRVIISIILSTLFLLCTWAYSDFMSVRSSSYPANTYLVDLIRLSACIILASGAFFFLEGKSFFRRFILAGGVMILTTLLTIITMLLFGDGIHQFLTEIFFKST